MLDPTIAQELGKNYRQDMMREAEQKRLVKQAQANQSAGPNLRQRLSDQIGTQLVRAGEWIKQQAPMPETGTLTLAEE